MKKKESDKPPKDKSRSRKSQKRNEDQSPGGSKAEEEKKSRDQPTKTSNSQVKSMLKRKCLEGELYQDLPVDKDIIKGYQ